MRGTAVLLAALSSALAAQSIPPPPPGWGALTLFDDFEGNALNGSLWEPQVGPWRGGVYLADNVEVAGGELLLHTHAQNISVNGTQFYVSSGAVNTQGRVTQAYGRWEVNAWMPDVNQTTGFRLHSSIWLVNVLPWAGCKAEKAPEIDIVEYDPTWGNKPVGGPWAAGHFHAYWKNCTASWSPDQYWVGGQQAYALSEGFHTWGLSWKPDSLSMDIDGVTMMNVTASQGHQQAEYLAAMTDPLYLLLTSCVMLREPLASTDKLPQVYKVDWVRAFAYQA